jgi:dienelactone hydrolase
MAVVLIPGATGWTAGYGELAKMLADSGFTTLGLDYYAETGRDSSSAHAAQLRPAWDQTVASAIAYLRAANPNRLITLIGFSRGVSLALDVASSKEGVDALVSFYGAGPADSALLEKQVSRLPPVLILHGDSDKLAPVEQAYRLHDAIVKQRGRVEMHIFSGAKHGFSVPGRPTYSEPAARAAWSDVLQFLSIQSRRGNR